MTRPAKRTALQDQLARSGAKVAAAPPERDDAGMTVPAGRPVKLKALTVHFPADVVELTKEIAAIERRLVQDIVAEAMNMLFASRRRPEIAPRKIKN